MSVRLQAQGAGIRVTEQRRGCFLISEMTGRGSVSLWMLLAPLSIPLVRRLV